ncbi:hypothetical protein LXL04_013434 [Taraxacum kok-saghyz]
MWDRSFKRTIDDISKTPASQKPLIDINVRRFLPPTPASQNQSLQRRRKRRPRLLLPISASEDAEFTEERTEDHDTTSSQLRRSDRGGFPYDML